MFYLPFGVDFDTICIATRVILRWSMPTNSAKSLEDPIKAKKKMGGFPIMDFENNPDSAIIFVYIYIYIYIRT